MQTLEFMEKVQEVHDRLNAIAIEHGVGFTAMVACGRPGEDTLTHGVSNMEYDEQITALHLFHNYIDTQYVE